MELIDKVNDILKKMEIDKPILDLYYDEQGNLSGFISSTSFQDMTEFEAQTNIWKKLKNNLGADELVKILGIFSETPEERINRINGSSKHEIKAYSNKLWIHKTKDEATFWILLDVSKFEEIYKSFFLIINEKYNYKKGLTFVYNEEVIKFMELEQDEIYEELFSNVYNNAEAEIKMVLMNKYDELTKNGLWGKSNMYNYVYETFKLTPYPFSKLVLNQSEIALFKDAFKSLDDFKAKKDIEKRIDLSEIIIKNKQTL